MTRGGGMKRLTAAVVAGIALGVGLVFRSAVAAQQRVPSAPSRFESDRAEEAHQVMLAQAHRLQSMLNGFLSGQADLVVNNSDAIAKDMNEMARSAIKTAPEFSSGEWQSLAELSDAAKQTTRLVQMGKPTEALRHYHRMIQSCVVCHETRRVWESLESEGTAHDSSGR